MAPVLHGSQREPHQQRGPFWTPITPPTGSFFHAELQAPPLLAAAAGFRQWIGGGGARPPLRAALVRFWVRQRVLRLSFPLTGARALHADAPWAEHD